VTHDCEVNTARFASGPNDPRYRPCGKPASIKEHDTWMCAEHYDQYIKQLTSAMSAEDDGL
jgi:hypothetical protein